MSAHEGSLCPFSDPCKLYSVCAQCVTFSLQDDSQSLQASRSTCIEELLEAAANEKAWALIVKSLEESIDTETPTKPQIDQMRTRRQVRQIADK